MNLSKLADACLYFMAGAVVFAIVAAFAGEMPSGAAAKQSKVHYAIAAQPVQLTEDAPEVPAEPIILSSTESAEAFLAQAAVAVPDEPIACVDGSCEVVERQPVRAVASGVCGVASSITTSQPVRTIFRQARTCSRPARRGILFRWRRR